LHIDPVEITHELISKIEKEGTKEEFGAREIERTIHKLVEDPLAEQLLNK
jgi:ATP-dependent Clp protease ATP-binding subunit ClpA